MGVEVEGGGFFREGGGGGRLLGSFLVAKQGAMEWGLEGAWGFLGN